MYSYEDRIRAVELFIKLGMRVRPTIRQLGYPTKNSLKGWYREYQQRQDLPKGYAGREPKFSQPQKAAALEHYLTHDRCIAGTMRALGYPGRGTLTNWIREAFPEARMAVVGSVGQRRYPESLKQAGVMELCTRQELRQTRTLDISCARILHSDMRVPVGREVDNEASVLRTELPPEKRQFKSRGRCTGIHSVTIIHRRAPSNAPRKNHATNGR